MKEVHQGLIDMFVACCMDDDEAIIAAARNLSVYPLALFPGRTIQFLIACEHLDKSKIQSLLFMIFMDKHVFSIDNQIEICNRVRQLKK